MKLAMALKSCNTPLDQILGSSVVLNWSSLGLATTVGAITIEYHVGSEGVVESLKLWACAREYWSLICDYAPNAGWSDGPLFSNGYHSRRLGRLLQSILMNQGLFAHTRNPNTNGMVEIGVPTVQQTTDARSQVSETFAGLQ
ncbi:MAG TPA: hypothetical protein VMI32_12790 [Candidatus Solibacter sp.]|nr:hypothetical protein [Candidatus Solibacter sp.]